MSSETPIIRNFKGLGGFEALIRQSGLIVNQGYGNSATLEVGDTITIPAVELRGLGMSIEVPWSDSERDKAILESGLTAEDIDLVVIAESGFLKNRDVLKVINISNVQKLEILVGYMKIRDDVLLDKRHGFNIHLFLALNKQIPHIPLRPRRMGTILAQAEFAIRPTKLGNGLRPKPLTEEIISQYGLSKTSVVFVAQETSLLETDAIDEAVSIYLNEELFNSLGQLRSPEAKLLQTVFAIDALKQIIYLVSKELGKEQIRQTDIDSTIVTFLHQQLVAAQGKNAATKAENAKMIKDEPNQAAALVSSLKTQKASFMALISGEEE